MKNRGINEGGEGRKGQKKEDVLNRKQKVRSRWSY
jgi:hypothetical protein